MMKPSLQTIAIASTFSASLAPGVYAQNFGGFPASTDDIPTIGVDGAPQDVALGLFNADSHLDAATANLIGNVSVLLGDGDGTFTPAPQQPYPADNGSYAVAIGDLNNDGDNDIAVANKSSNNVTVLLGAGDGTFEEPMDSPFDVDLGPANLAIGDLNDDDNQDIAVANHGSGSVSLLFGSGDGTFMPQETIRAGDGPYDVVIVDLDEDGALDLAVANTEGGNVTVLLGVGDGTFNEASGSPVEVGDQPVSIAAADFDVDGHLDLATANRGSDDVSVLLGDGEGMFDPAPDQPFAAGPGAGGVDVSDLSNNCALDLIVANRNDDTVSVLLGNADGTFQTQQVFDVGDQSEPFFAEAGDLDMDGSPDAAVALFGDDAIASLINETMVGDITGDSEVDGSDLGELLGA